MKEFCKKTVIFLKKIWERRKAQHREAERRTIVRVFNVRESGGNLYIICDGHAVKKIDDTATAREIVEMVEGAKQANVHYHALAL